jgi:hypothetical protein
VRRAFENALFEAAFWNVCELTERGQSSMTVSL